MCFRLLVSVARGTEPYTKPLQMRFVLGIWYFSDVIFIVLLYFCSKHGLWVHIINHNRIVEMILMRTNENSYIHVAANSLFPSAK